MMSDGLQSKSGTSVLELSHKDARAFFLKGSSYCSIELPFYFRFDQLLIDLAKKIGNKKISDIKRSLPSDFENVNYKILSNKDSKFSWRPFEIINPALYVLLVNEMTSNDNWKKLVGIFKEFQGDSRIVCQSIPVRSETDLKDKAIQIQHWWSQIEQKSIALALEYDFVIHTDITDFYPSIYTHSISWAIHGKSTAKMKSFRNNKKHLGNQIDFYLREMSFGQTNGIPQGSVLMDFISEILLGSLDKELSARLNSENISSFKILRYRDDYRIFSNDQVEALKILKILTEVLSGFGLKLNASKTFVSDNVIRSSIRKDKILSLNYFKSRNLQRQLLQIYAISEEFPDSSSLRRELSSFHRRLLVSKKIKSTANVDVLISITSEILVKNPKMIALGAAILSELIGCLKNIDEKKQKIDQIKRKLSKIPNTGVFEVWLQRMTLEIDQTIQYQEGLCGVVLDKNSKIWEDKWIKDSSLKELLKSEGILDLEFLSLAAMSSSIAPDEFEIFEY